MRVLAPLNTKPTGHSDVTFINTSSLIKSRRESYGSRDLHRLVEFYVNHSFLRPQTVEAVKMYFNCDSCNRTFKKFPNNSKHNFCSHNCKGDWQREKLKGKNNPFYGKEHTESTKQKISSRNKGKLLGEKHHNWQGGFKTRPEGYIRRSSDDKYVHRIIMEKKLGRKLKTEELVHHIDGNPKNNSISNLEIITNSKHRKLHVLKQERDSLGKFKN